MWKWRGLTLIGKMQIVKSFAIPKFMSKASLIHVSKDLIQAVNKELYSFIWKGKDKVKRLALTNDIENGGLKMLDIESMVLAQRTMCSLAFSVTLDTKLRAFQYKLLNHIVYTNDRLYKFKIVDSPLCAFCNSENESLEHLLFLCKASEVFWKEVLSWLAIHKNELLNVSLTDVLFGKFDIDKDFMAVNHVLLLGKYFIYRCKLDNIKPSLAVFKAKLKATLNLEFYIVRKKGTLAQHHRKWNIFIPVLI